MPLDDKFVERYLEWFATRAGAFAFAQEKRLLEAMVSGWPRRGHSLLEVGCGPGLFLEVLWEAGFEVSGLDASAAMLKAARSRLGQRADFHLGRAEHLPFEDKEYDFVVLITVLEFCDDPAEALAEAVRVARKGVLVGLLNRYSIYRLTHGIHWPGSRSSMLRRGCWQSWLEVLRLLQQAAGKRPHKSRSVLPGPMCSWRDSRVLSLCNRWLYPPFVGAFTMVRYDLTGERPLTPLLAFKTEPRTG